MKIELTKIISGILLFKAFFFCLTSSSFASADGILGELTLDCSKLKRPLSSPFESNKFNWTMSYFLQLLNDPESKSTLFEFNVLKGENGEFLLDKKIEKLLNKKSWDQSLNFDDFKEMLIDKGDNINWWGKHQTSIRARRDLYYIRLKEVRDHFIALKKLLVLLPNPGPDFMYYCYSLDQLLEKVENIPNESYHPISKKQVREDISNLIFYISSISYDSEMKINSTNGVVDKESNTVEPAADSAPGGAVGL